MESSSGAPTSSIPFVSNAIITGGTFRQQHHHHHREVRIQGAKDGFEYLKEAVASAAFHNSGDRFDPPKCHPNTRVAVQRKVMDWILRCDPETRNSLIMWLTGPAGAGKSAIAQTIAELCYEEGRLLASFFFDRLDLTRNNAKSLFSTIAYQISAKFPVVRDKMAAVVENDPLIFTRSLITQFMSLVIDPLRSLFESGSFNHPNSPCLILIDGLDECLDRHVQRNILEIILKSIQQLRVPFIFLISSRPGHEISAVFNSWGKNSVLTRLLLDDSYLPDRDIELFLRDQFEDVKEHHPFKKFIPPPWPTDDIIERLVQKSSGQFIYASTIVKYVKALRHRPTKRLDIILNLIPAHHDMPFAELDALFSHILTAVEEIELVLQIVSFILLTPYRCHLEVIESVLSFDRGDLQILFCDLGSVVAIRTDHEGEYFHILHASLSDFLEDKMRSKEFHLDLGLKRTEHLRVCFRYLTHNAINSNSIHRWAMNFIESNCESAVPTAELRSDVLEFSIAQMYMAASEGSDRHRALATIWDFNYHFLPKFFSWLANSKFDNASHLHNHHLQSFDQVLMHHLDTYYADARFTLLVALVDFSMTDQHFRKLIFKMEFMLFDVDATLLDVDRGRLHLLLSCSQHIDYHQLVIGFLRNPLRSRAHALNGARFATAALCCLGYLCDHSSHREAGHPRYTNGRRHTNQIRITTPWMWRRRIGKQSVLEKARVWWTNYYDRIYHQAKEEIFPSYNTDHPAIAERIHSDKYSFGLDYFVYFLSRSAKSEELIESLNRRTFAIRSLKFPRQTQRARHAITEYLERIATEAT